MKDLLSNKGGKKKRISIASNLSVIKLLDSYKPISELDSLPSSFSVFFTNLLKEKEKDSSLDKYFIYEQLDRLMLM